MLPESKAGLLLRSIDEEDWGDIRRLRTFQSNHLLVRMRDDSGRLRPAQERAEILATHYEKVWAPSTSFLDDGRDPLFGAAIIYDGDFTPTELREVRKKIKKNKVAGTDDIPSELILLLLSFPQGFTLVLSLMCQMLQGDSQNLYVMNLTSVQ